MKTAIAIKSCHALADRRQTLLDTWLKDVDTDFFFVVGDPVPLGSDMLYIRGAADDFKNIAPKVLGAVQYALSDNIKKLLVLDDDTYVCWSRMKKVNLEGPDYLGFVRNHGLIPYMQGSCYWLSEHSMELIARAADKMINGVTDDSAVGACLYGEVQFTHEHRFAVGDPYPQPDRWPNSDNDVVACHKMNFMSMHAAHERVTQIGK